MPDDARTNFLSWLRIQEATTGGLEGVGLEPMLERLTLYGLKVTLRSGWMDNRWGALIGRFDGRRRDAVGFGDTPHAAVVAAVREVARKWGEGA